MKRVSAKQAAINATLRRIKATMGERCAICGGRGCDLSHILPRSLYPEYVTEPRNLQILCRECHERFDNDREFRREQIEIYERARLLDECAAHRYFCI